MTNGPNSFTTLVAQRGSPQPVLGSGRTIQLPCWEGWAKWQVRQRQLQIWVCPAPLL